ncbi:MAG: DUF11 domain-containing protein [Caldilineaceae bacterium]|nr:DUF11 domain-containing protein [Caldilineaceae bacterium]
MQIQFPSSRHWRASMRNQWPLFAILLALALLGSNLQLANAATGDISTIGGTGVREFGGDNGPATSASFDTFGMAVDSAGNLYIADLNNHRIRKIDPNGMISTVAGNGVGEFSGDGGPATSAGLYYPHDVAIDAADNLYIADLSTNRIRKVDTNGIITTVVGNGVGEFSGDGGPATSAGIYGPKGIAVDRAGNLYIADFNNSRIRKVDTNGIITTVAGNGTSEPIGDGIPATDAGFSWPVDVEVDAAGNLYIIDESAQRVYQVDTAGMITVLAGNGEAGFSGDGGPSTSARLSSPRRVVLDGADNLYISDMGNFRVRKIDPSGIITTVAGNGEKKPSGDGGPATSAGLAGPYGMAFDRAGNLYIGDMYRIRKVEGVFTPAAERRSCTQDEFLVAVKEGEKSGTITLDGTCTYQLTSASDQWNGGSGAFIWTATVIEGNGAVIERSSDAPAFRILAFQSKQGTVVRNVTIRNGKSTQAGGGLFANSNLTLENVTLEGNASTAQGGALFAQGQLVLQEVTIQNNEADKGGAIAQFTGSLTIANSRLLNNQAKDFGGAIYKDGDALEITNTLFAQNQAGSGSGTALFLGGKGGATAQMTNSTITDNAGNTGTAITLWAAFTLRNTIIANHATALASGSKGAVSEDYNLFAGNQLDVRTFNDVVVERGGHSIQAADPQFVDATALNYAIKVSSPAIDKGTDTVLASSNLSTDAAKLARPFSGTLVDIGAYEFQGEGGPSLSIVKQGPHWIAAGVAADYSLSIANNGIRSGNDLVVVDLLPTGAAYVDGSAAQGGTFADGQLSWQIGTLAPGESKFITYTVVASQTLVSQNYNVQSATEPAVIAQGKVITTPLNAKLVANLGFFPRPDGFSFPNYSDSPDSDLTVADIVFIFGEKAVCKATNPCVLTAEAEAWRKTWLKNVAGGHCAGMAMGSLDIFANAAVTPSDFQSGANVTFELTKENARKWVALYATTQGTQPTTASTLRDGGYEWTPASTPVAVLDTLIANLKDPNATDRYRLSFRKPPSEGGGDGHTVVPFAVEQLNEHEYLIYIYENNAPNQFDLAIRVNRTTGDWTYVGTTNPDKPLYKYWGNATTGNLSLTSWQWAHTFPKTCDFTCLTPTTAQSGQQKLAMVGNLQGIDLQLNSGILEVQLDGEGYQLVTRSDGKRVGFDLTTGEWIAEVEGAYTIDILTGLGLNTPPAIRIPHEEGMTYTVQIASRATAYGNTEAPANVNIFGPGFVLNLTDLVLNSPDVATADSSADLMQLDLDPATKRVTFAPGLGSTEAPSLALALTKADGADYSVVVKNVTVAQGHAVALTFDEASQSIALEDNSTGETAYQVEVQRINLDGTQNTFASDAVSDGGSAGVTLQVGEEWNGEDAPALQVEETSSLPAPVVVAEAPTATDLTQSNTYLVKTLTSDTDADWQDGGVWVIGGRLAQRIVALSATSLDGGETLEGTMAYAGEGPIGFRATQVEPNTYTVENHWGNADDPWNPGGTWILGNREGQGVVAIEIASEDAGNSLVGTLTYADEEPISFRAILEPTPRPTEAATPAAETADSAEPAATESTETPVAAVAACNPADVPAPTQADVMVRFVNERAGVSLVSWQNFDNQLQEYHRLEPGASVDQETYAGHTWVMTDEAGNVLLEYTASAEVTQCVVSE